MKLTTAGESHGKMLIGIIEGLPSNMQIDIEEIDKYLALRQTGYGRGDRQKIEKDRVEILSGVRNLKTLASPLAFCVKNNDYANWSAYMAPEGADVSQKTLTKVRPGHADLTGMIKFGQQDARNVLERASARETAVRVAAGTIAGQYLRKLGISVSGYIKQVCSVKDDNFYPFEKLESAKGQPLFMLDSKKQSEAMALIDSLKQQGDTAGGIAEIRISGLKSGFGSCMTYAEKLDAILCSALMSIQAVKGVEVGLGMTAATLPGSRVHDEIFNENGRYIRRTNNAGGIEGGMSNGEELVLHAAMKPIPTLMQGLRTVDTATGQATTAAGERSDVCAICAFEVIAESVTAFALADVVSKRLGGDTMEEAAKRYSLLP